MGSRTKAQRDQEECIKQMIVDGHRRGVCNKEGQTTKTKDGRPVATPRRQGHVTYREVFKRYA